VSGPTLVQMSRLLAFALLTSASAVVVNYTIAFVDERVAKYVSIHATPYRNNSILRGYWHVPGVYCSEEVGAGAQNDSSACWGYNSLSRRSSVLPPRGDDVGVPVYTTCAAASAVSALGRCLGWSGEFVPLGVVTLLYTRAHHDTLFRFHYITNHKRP